VRIGVLSDTHGTLPNEVLDLFAEVDLILHAGDVGDPDILTTLQALAPVHAVWGNCDGFDVRRVTTERVEVRIDGFDLLVLHGHQYGRPDPESVALANPGAEIIVFGHTHRPVLALVDQVVTVMNPGSAGDPRHGLPPSAGILELEPGIPPRGRLVAF
jgi:hypothetical protein